MFLYEYEGKRIFKEAELPVPPGDVAKDIETALKIARNIGYPVVLKPQITGGRRGKAGAIRFANNDDELKKHFEDLISKSIHGKRVQSILIERKVSIKHEYYLAFLLDFSKAAPLLMFSVEGGIEIEEIASRFPEKLIKFYIDPTKGLKSYDVYAILNKAGITGAGAKKFVKIILKLWEAFSKYDLILAEINPLVETIDGDLLALDAKVVIDDNSEFRQPLITEFKQTRGGVESLEYKAKSKGLAFVVIDEEGDIGVIGNGAGLTMATVDVLRYLNGKPVNFLDIGGGARAERVKNAIEIILQIPSVKRIFINIFGGITRCDEVAKGIVEAYKDLNLQIPLIVRLTGTLEEEGRKILQEVGIHAYIKMLEAAEKAVRGEP